MNSYKSLFRNRNNYIDYLRGLSILLVVVTHGFLNLKWLIFTNLLPKANFDILRSNGYLGVSIFFVVSGYLITQKIVLPRIDKQGIFDSLGDNLKLSDFYLSRALRIFPPLILLFLITLILANSNSQYFADFKVKPSWLLYVAAMHAFTFTYNNFYLGLGGSTIGIRHLIPLWSLSIEEVFYFGWPILIKIFKSKLLIILVLVLIIFLSPVYRIEHGYISEYYLLGCVDMLALGCLAAICSSSIKKLRKKSALSARVLIFILLVSVLTIIDIHLHYVLAQTIVGVLSALYLLTSETKDPVDKSKNIFFGLGLPLQILGVLSYEIYLFHLMFMNIFYRLDFYNGSNYLLSVIPLGTLVLFSSVLHFILFEPFRKKVLKLSRSHKSGAAI